MSAIDLELKSLTQADLSPVLELDKACFGGLWTLSAYQRELDSPNSDLLGLFSPLYPSLILGMGCFWSILDEAHITLLAVNPKFHRQGLGEALVYSLLKTARERGLKDATLEARADNLAALSLYEKFGFKTAGRRRKYYKDNNEDALILWLGDIESPQFQDSLTHWQQNITAKLLQSGWSLIIGQ